MNDDQYEWTDVELEPWFVQLCEDEADRRGIPWQEAVQQLFDEAVTEHLRAKRTGANPTS